MSAARAYDRRIVSAWSLYDFANSAFTTIVVTFIYAAYFTDQIAPDPITGINLWSKAVSATAIVVAVLSPFVGAMADRGGLRKRYLFVCTAVCVAGSVALFFPMPGEVWAALLIFVLANIAFEMGGVFYNAFLPDIAPQDHIGRVSGYGWAAGYIGGLISLVVGYFVLVAPEVPPFGLDRAAGEHVRASSIVVAAWFALFSIPMFLWVPERRVADRPNTLALFRSAARELRTTFANIRTYRNIVWLLVARLIYNDGLITIFAFGGIYAKETFGFSFEDLFLFGIGLNAAAGLGAWLFGFFDDRAGGRVTILVTLVGLVIAAAIAVFAPDRTWFWVAAILVGLLAGPNQSASRSLMGRFTPPRHESEFFGFFAFSGKFTAFLGPLLLGELSSLFRSQRAGVAVVVAFFLVGGILLLKVNEKEGMAASGRLRAQPA
jgi:UMF1 family MFS transporter